MAGQQSPVEHQAGSWNLPGWVTAARPRAALSIHVNRWVWVAALFVGAYGIRVLYPQIYMSGFDMPGHVMASMRLHLTSPFDFQNWISNSIAQILLFNHGYTTLLLPWLFYETAFSLLGLPLNETVLTCLHSLIGLLSLASIFFFVQTTFGFRAAWVTTGLVAVTPIHIGLSRAHVGTQIISSIFFFACLGLLARYLDHRRRRWKNLYYLSLFFYIGSENIFFVGLLLQAVFAVLVSGCRGWRDQLWLLRDLYFNPLALAVIVLPVAAYTGTALVQHLYSMDGGYFDRLVTKVYKREMVIEPLRVWIWMAKLFGPIVLAAAGGLVEAAAVFFSTGRQGYAGRQGYTGRHFLSGPRMIQMPVLSLGVTFAVYFILLNLSTHIERNYVFSVLVPTAVLAGVFLARRPALFGLTLLAALIYSGSVVYQLRLPFETTTNYGSVEAHNTELGQVLKTLGYLNRSGALTVSTAQVGPAEQVGVLSESASAFYYLGQQTSRSAADSLANAWQSDFERFLLVAATGSDSEDNLAILKAVHTLNLRKVGEIRDKGQLLAELYSNRVADKVLDVSRLPQGTEIFSPDCGWVFQSDRITPLFDQEYATLDRLPKVYLGHFGYKLPDQFP